MARYARRDLSSDLTDFTITDAVARFRDLDDKHRVVPDAARGTLNAAIDTIINACRTLDLSQLDEVVKGRTEVIAAASGIPRAHHSRILPIKEAEPLHLHRNVLLTLVLASICGHDGDVRPLAESFPTYHRRTTIHNRAHTDDEMVLLRVFGLHQSTGDKNNRRASAVFAMCDTGLLPLETTQVRTGDLVLPERADEGGALLEPPGINRISTRLLTAEPLATTLLHRYTTGLGSKDCGPLLTYRPRDAYDPEIALSSADGILKRMRIAVGINHKDVTAASIWKWRADYTRRTLGITAALKVSGLASANALDAALRIHSITDPGSMDPKKPATFSLDDEDDDHWGFETK